MIDLIIVLFFYFILLNSSTRIILAAIAYVNPKTYNEITEEKPTSIAFSSIIGIIICYLINSLYASGIFILSFIVAFFIAKKGSYV